MKCPLSPKKCPCFTFISMAEDMSLVQLIHSASFPWVPGFISSSSSHFHKKNHVFSIKLKTITKSLNPIKSND